MRTGSLFLAVLLGLSACQSKVELEPTGEETGGSGGSGASGGSGGSGASGGGESCLSPDNAAAFEVGTGEKCFERLMPNDEVPLMSGPQGGYHLWLAIGCQDCSSPVELRYGVHDPQTNTTYPETWDSQAMIPLQGQGFPQAAGMVINMPGISWDPMNYPPPPKGTHVVIWAQAYEGGALIHEAQVEVVIGDIMEWNPCEDDPQNPNCQLG